MARGGPRSGAGRPKGATNKTTAERLEAIKATGMTPLEYLTSVYQDENAEEAKRIDAAKAAAPYVHPRLNAVELSGNPDAPLVSRIELVDGDGTD
jgi:hypothetical protein